MSFLSTLPARGATLQPGDRLHRPQTISIHAPREGSDQKRPVQRGKPAISIHAPREGSDGIIVETKHKEVRHISIHAPREGSDNVTKIKDFGSRIFLSTLPARGATPRQPARLKSAPPISIHAPREGSDIQGFTCFCIRSAFLSTLPARGATLGGDPAGCPRRGFLSTLPARGATAERLPHAGRKQISIHAPREGSDDLRLIFERSCHISIHAPREGSDVMAVSCKAASLRHFYPRSPRGERRRCLGRVPLRPGISIHAPREGSDQQAVQAAQAEAEFLSTLPARGATCPHRSRLCRCRGYFYPRSPRGERRHRGVSFCPVGYFYPRSPRGERPWTS